jgi:hypothetical protein
MSSGLRGGRKRGILPGLSAGVSGRGFDPAQGDCLVN